MREVWIREIDNQYPGNGYHTAGEGDMNPSDFPWDGRLCFYCHKPAKKYIENVNPNICTECYKGTEEKAVTIIERLLDKQEADDNE